MNSRLYFGDCLDVLRSLEAASLYAVVSDPPYGLEFMGKEWDRLEPGRNIQRWAGTERKLIGGPTEGNWLGGLPSYRPTRNKKCRLCGSYRFSGSPCTCDEPDWDIRQDEHTKFLQAWHVEWLREVHRVLVPDGLVRIFCGSKTHHRLASAMEMVGFRDIALNAWCYGNGFPKNLDVSKAVDAHVMTGKTHSKSIRLANDARPKTGRSMSRLVGSFMGGMSKREGEHVTYEQRDTWYETDPATSEGSSFFGFGTAMKPAWEPILEGRV